MLTFFKWCEEKKLDLPIETDAQPATKKTIEEKTKRAGISDNYPDAYAQKKLYPPGYFMPITATAAGKLQGKIGS